MIERMEMGVSELVDARVRGTEALYAKRAAELRQVAADTRRELHRVKQDVQGIVRE